jgi:hypothetical protein
MMIKTTGRITRRVFLPVLCALVVLLAGCGAGGAGSVSFGKGEAPYADFSEEAAGEAYAGNGFKAADDASRQPESPAPSAAASGKTRKLIRSADLSIEADKSLIGKDGGVCGAAQKLEEMADRHNGYIEQSRVDASSLHCTVRVPAASFDEFLSGMSALGKIISRSENAEDVTIKYYDLEGRLAVKKNLLATFQSYLGRAKNIEEIMQVETRIADLQNEIDWLGTQLTELANLVDYSTVSLYLFNPREVHSYTLGDRILILFGSFGDFASGAVLVILGIVIFGVPVLVLVILAYWLLLGKIGLLKKAFRLASGADKTNTSTSKGEIINTSC